MDIGSLSLLLVGTILFLLTLGVPLAFAAALVGLVLGYTLFGIPGIILLMQRVYSISTEYILLSVPLFLLMAALLERSGIAREMFNALDAWTGRIRGGVLIVTALMGTIMAAMSGIIGGEIVILGLVALPQMLRLGYDRKLSIGMTCAAGSLGTMLPPSVVLIVYGLVAGTSISDLFLAGIIPGLLLATGYIAYALGICRLRPEMAPKVEREPISFADKMRASKGMIAPVLIVGVIFGFIYGGVTSITEAAAMAALLTFIVVVLRGEMTWVLFSGALKQTLVSIGVILWVTFGATMLTGSFSLAGGPSYIANSISELGFTPFATILVILLLFVILGMFIDWIGILLLTMPVLIPVVDKLGFDLIWFGILFCLTMQISYLTPPFGPAAFYLKSVVPDDISIVEIFHSFIPFIVIQIIVIALVLLFPQLSLALL